jgi:hypothetical protein
MNRSNYLYFETITKPDKTMRVEEIMISPVVITQKNN